MKRSFKNHSQFTGKLVAPTRRINRYFDLAKNVAFNSDYGKLRHGAILVKGGSVINTCFNKDKFCSFGGKFRAPDRGPATIHAELGCVLGISRDVTSGVLREFIILLTKVQSKCTNYKLIMYMEV